LVAAAAAGKQFAYLFIAVVSSTSSDSECRFPDEFSGDWMSFDGRSISNVHIGNDGILTSVSSGHVTSLVCKEKHRQRPFYRVLQVQNNGWLGFLWSLFSFFNDRETCKCSSRLALTTVTFRLVCRIHALKLDKPKSSSCSSSIHAWATLHRDSISVTI
jgi:hypothetical protein